MSEQEFENWLALLAGLLKLSPEQRNNISDELRSHLEERMEDLIDAGSSREAAIAAALEEFGDTAALAHHFTSIAHQHRRRLMRYTYGTIAAVTCSILVLAAFWPQPDGPVTQKLTAQPAADGFGSAEAGDAAGDPNPFQSGDDDATAASDRHSPPFQGSREKIEAKLAAPLPRVDYFEMPFLDVIVDLSDTTGLTITIDPSLLQGEIQPDAIINLQFPENAVSAITLLELAFKSLQIADIVGYTIRDNIVLITLKEDTQEVVIYNCRDLIPAGTPHGGGFGNKDGGEEEMFVNYQLGGGGLRGLGGGDEEDFYGGGGGFGGVPGLGGGMKPMTPEQQLIQVITGTIEPENWSEVSGGAVGSIQSINGLIVINHTREVHDQVKQLLQLLRDAMKEGA